MASVYGAQRTSLKSRATVFVVALFITLVAVAASFPAREKPALWLAIIPSTLAACAFWLGLYYLWRLRIQFTPEEIRLTVPFRSVQTVRRKDIDLITAVSNKGYAYYRLDLKDGRTVNISPVLFRIDPPWDHYLRTFARAEM